MAGAGNMSREQENVLKLIELKYSVFLTGRGGSGKSFLIKEIIKKESSRGNCVVTASTGIAAEHIGGITIHSFAGIGTGTKSAHELLGIVLSNEEAVKRWKECRLLIVDEISMVGSALFEKLDYVARGTRQSSQPFGGIQLLLAGDFSQLPPVSKEFGMKQKYCFCSPLWKKCLDFCSELTTVYRQNEHELLNLLEDMRNGQMSTTSRILLNQLTRELPCHPLDKVRLFPRREDAAKANDECLNLLPGETLHFQSRDAGEKCVLDGRCSATSNLSLKVNARVVLLKNLDKTLVNGMRGTVIRFDEGYPVVHFDNNRVNIVRPTQFIVEDGDRVLGTRTQVPLDLCYGMTIHKSQGSSYSFVEVDLKHVFEEGQAYVALSRCQTLSGLRVLNFNERVIKPNICVKKFYKTLTTEEEIEKCFEQLPPKVRETINLGKVDLASTIPFKSPACEPSITNIAEVSTQQNMNFNMTDLHAASQWLEQHVISDKLMEFFQVLKLLPCDNVEDLDPYLINFMAWLIQYFTQQTVSAEKTNEVGVTIVEQNQWGKITTKLHSFLRSSLLLDRWKQCLQFIGISDIDIGLCGLHRKACMAFTRAMYETYLSIRVKKAKDVLADDQSNFKQGPLNFSSPESMGKMRDIAGWVIVKESNACLSYIKSFKGSKQVKVQDRIKTEREIKSVLDNLKASKEVLLESTKYPESMDHIETHDKGSKAHVTDEFYEYMIAVGSHATLLLSDKTLSNFKEDSIQLAWKSLLSNQELKRKFEKMITDSINVTSRATNACTDTVSSAFYSKNVNCDTVPCTDKYASSKYYVEDNNICPSEESMSLDGVEDCFSGTLLDDTPCVFVGSKDDESLVDHVELYDNENSTTNVDQHEMSNDIHKAIHVDVFSATSPKPANRPVIQLVNNEDELYLPNIDSLSDDKLLGTIPENDSIIDEEHVDENLENINSDFWNGIGKILHYRILHRYMNMYSAEYVRKLKRDEKIEKSVALRPGVTGYSKGGKTRTKALTSLSKGKVLPTVTEIINDPLPKNFTHHSMKAQAYKGHEVFLKHFSHKELKFIFQGYAVPYPKNKKEQNCIILTDILKKSGDTMPFPEKLSQEMFDAMSKSASQENSKPNQSHRQVDFDDVTVATIGVEEQHTTTKTTGTNEQPQKKKRKCSYCGQEGHRKKYKDKLTCPQYIKDTQLDEMISQSLNTN